MCLLNINFHNLGHIFTMCWLNIKTMFFMRPKFSLYWPHWQHLSYLLTSEIKMYLKLYNRNYSPCICNDKVFLNFIFPFYVLDLINLEKHLSQWLEFEEKCIRQFIIFVKIFIITEIMKKITFPHFSLPPIQFFFPHELFFLA